MGRKRAPGLIQRDGIWHIDKRIGGRRVCQSTGTTRLEEAEKFLARLMEEIRQANVYGVRPVRTFEQAAIRFVQENQHKRSIDSDVGRLKALMPLIGAEPLRPVTLGHNGQTRPSYAFPALDAGGGGDPAWADTMDTLRPPRRRE